MLFLLPGALWAQGTDCSNATQVSSVGSFVYNTSFGGSTNFGASTPCNDYATGLAYEGYFQWTATVAGDYTLSIPNFDGDTRLAIYEGPGCAATCVARGQNRQGPAFVERFVNLFGVAAGDTYLVQIANTAKLPSSGTGNIGALTIEDHPCSPVVAQDDYLEENDTCATAVPLLPGSYLGLTTFVQDTDFYTIQVPPFSTASFSAPLGSADIAIREYSALCHPMNGSSFAFVTVNDTFQTLSFTLEVFPLTGESCKMYDLDFIVNTEECYTGQLSDDSLEDNDTCGEAAPLTSGTYLDLWTMRTDVDFYEIEVPSGFELSYSLIEGADLVSLRVYDDACQLAPGTPGIRTNFGPEPVKYILEAYPSSNQVIGCGEYSLQIDVTESACASLGLDALSRVDGGFAMPPTLGNGTYPGLYLTPQADFYFLCLGPMDTITIDVSLQAGVGEIQSFLQCSSLSGLCFLLPEIYATGVGTSYQLQYTNASTESLQAEIAIRFVPDVGEDPCGQLDLSIAGLTECTGESTYQTSDFCVSIQANSSGLSTDLSAFLLDPASPQMMLTASQGPVGQFGYFLVGTGQNLAGTPLGNGQLCLSTGPGQVLGRYNINGSTRNSLGRFDSLGRYENISGTSSSQNPWGYRIPTQTPWGAVFQPGETLHFQMWHREAGGQSNLSNGVALTQ